MFASIRLLLITFSLAASAAGAEPSNFDGAWQATMVCPPHNDDDDDAKGYTHQLVGQIADGELVLTHGKDQEPGWHILQGNIRQDGVADLRLQGVVNNSKYAINNAPKGKPYSYRVKAHFENNRGMGQRVTGRNCTFEFARR